MIYVTWRWYIDNKFIVYLLTIKIKIMKKIQAKTKANPEPSGKGWEKWKPLVMFLIGILGMFPIPAPLVKSLKKAVGVIDGTPKEQAAEWFGAIVVLLGGALYIYLTLQGDPQAGDILDIIDKIPQDTLIGE